MKANMQEIVSVIGKILLVASIAGIIFFAIKGIQHMIQYERLTDSSMYIEYMDSARNTFALAATIIAAEIGNSLRKFRRDY